MGEDRERDYNKVSPGMTQQMKEELRAFRIDPKEDVVLLQHRLELLVEKCRQKNHLPTDEDISMTLLDALDDSYESLRSTSGIHTSFDSVDLHANRRQEAEIEEVGWSCARCNSLCESREG